MMKQPEVDLTLIYTRILERYAAFFPRPEARLRFFNSTIAKQVSRQKKVEKSLKRIAFIEKTPLYRWVMESMLHRAIIEELSNLVPHSRAERKEFLRGAKISWGARLLFWMYRLRYPLYGVGLTSVALLLVGLYSLALWSGQRLNQYLAEKYGRGGNAPAGVITTTVAKYLPGYDPNKVWLVKSENGAEFYSNGGRILTEFETENHPRNYYLYAKDDPLKNLETPVQHQPIGILYHTTEGELVDFKPDNNDDLQRRGHGLMAYVKKEKSYNYVIDRFGQIYRIVRDDQAGFHAGHSIWSDDEYTYVSLNESFIGVAFETRTEADSQAQLTEAQITAGRQLTAILRSRYKIADANCTTHGLVSISQGTMLIGYHHDWAHNFQFEAMGVSEKYSVPPATVGQYGCGWGDDIVTKMGGRLWTGVPLAEEEFKKRAAKAQLKPDDLRRRMKERYSEQLNMMRLLRDANAHETDQATNKAEAS
ncbi:MAG: peptidoglycan recognition family protein [Blastocatellia bacterium]